ncbi:RepB family plasmid replication initiator protein [Pseudoalteromonas sp. ASV78]|uniref:RepB family plasmid replication initiator protein n=1 Tax=Pseudoalteromonas sp. ASV78 TaxID=3397851 RepID=UPI0039FD92CA
MGKNKNTHSCMSTLTKTNKKNLITQSNEISEAAYYLSLKAKRVLWMCFTQLKSSENADFTDGIFDVYVNDYQNLFGVSTQTASTDVKAGLSEISNSSVKFYPKEGEYEEIERPWLIEKAMRRGRGSYRVDFNPRLVPYIVGLTQQFTMFYLHECGRINNSRTIRLYENLCQWRNSGVWVITPQWLAERYKLPDSQKDNFAEMKRSFLEPAIKRINKETPLHVSYQTQLSGAKVDKILFNIVDGAGS